MSVAATIALGLIASLSCKTGAYDALAPARCRVRGCRMSSPAITGLRRRSTIQARRSGGIAVFVNATMSGRCSHDEASTVARIRAVSR
jgi:hypothetical protein